MNEDSLLERLAAAAEERHLFAEYTYRLPAHLAEGFLLVANCGGAARELSRPSGKRKFTHVSARDLQGVGHLIPRWRFHIREGQHGIREACALYFDRRNRLGQVVKFGVRELH